MKLFLNKQNLYFLIFFFLIKLFRLLRASKILDMLDKIEELLRPPAALMGLFRLFLMIAFVVHSCACLYWYAKMSKET
jgi:hypothetical protein